LGFRDEFALDCLLQGGVWCEPWARGRRSSSCGAVLLDEPLDDGFIGGTSD
jgi:hypothetical protein